MAKNNFNDAALRYIKRKNDQSFFLQPVVDEEAHSVFLGLNNTGSCDADGITTKLVKFVSD